MLKEIKHSLALWLRDNQRNVHKVNLTEFMRDRICFYANSNDTPAEQIKGMNRLLRDVIKLPDDMFGGQE